MKALITGSNGFLGKNLKKILQKFSAVEEILEYNRSNTLVELNEFSKNADIVFHLAAVLRPENSSGFYDNIELTSCLINYLENNRNKCPVMFASSTQAVLDNPYGQCKRIEETKFIEYGKKNDINVYIFRFPNIFGTMSRPNYTSVIATFCYNTINGLPIRINDPATRINFAFAETVLEDVINTVIANNPEIANKIINLDNTYSVGLGELAYYMETLKTEIEPQLRRNDDFYEKLRYTYNWHCINARITSTAQ